MEFSHSSRILAPEGDASYAIVGDAPMTDQAGPIDGHMREGGIGEVRLLSRIDNLEHLKAAYGEGAGLLVCEMVDRILRESGHRSAPIEQGVEGCAIVSCGAPRSLHALRRRLACTAM